jgi:hypothetical protein
MNNVNDILKRQLLLMKFDSGVTLKENHEKISGLINETTYGTGNWVEVSYRNRTLKLNNYLEMENRQGGDELQLWAGVTFVPYDYNLIAKDVTYNIVGDFRGQVIETLKGDIIYFCDKKEFMIQGRSLTFWGENFQKEVQKAFDDLCSELTQEEVKQEAANTVPPTSGFGDAKQGWTIDKVIKKYSCLNSNDFAELNVMNDTYGDIVKLNLGKNRRGNPVYGKMYVQDGYIQLWDSPYTRIGNSDQYMACINNELSFQSGQNLNLTDPATKGPQMESTNKIGKLIREAINLNVKTSAGASDGGSSGSDGSGTNAPRAPRPKVDVTPLVKEVQNKLKELDPTAVVSGTMDQETINKIMLQINKIVEKQDKEAEAKRIEDERVAAIQSVDSVVSGGGY